MNGIPYFKYSIRNAANGSVDIFIDGDIVTADIQTILEEFWGDDTTTSYKSFRESLDAVQAQVYNVYINSGGGVVTEAMAIHDLLKDLQAKGKTVNTIGRGIIASAATYILMAGNNPVMSENSWFMIHNVSGVAWGDVNQVENAARTLRQFNDRSRDFYAKATGISAEDISQMMNEETWLTATQAKEKGFIKQLENEVVFTQLIPKDKWQFKNMVAFNAYNASCGKKPSAPESTIQQFVTSQNEDMKKFLQKLADKIINGVKNIKAPENNDHQSLMNSVGEVINQAFQDAGEELDNAVNEAIKNGTDFTKGEFKTAFENAVKAALECAVTSAVENATKPMTDRLAQLEKTNGELVQKNKDLETEVTNMKGGQSTSTKPTQQEKKRFGSFA